MLLDFPTSSQEIEGSNSRRVNFLLILDKFFFLVDGSVVRILDGSHIFKILD